MKSELDAIISLVEFKRDSGGRISAKGPRDFDLKGEVSERVELVRNWIKANPKPPIADFGTCEICRMPMPNHKAGACDLCSCAIQKVRDERRAK